MEASNDIYLLSRDAGETQRLNEQHKLFVINNGYTIHPSILPRLSPTACVADIAAGSGAWTLGAAQILSPEAQLVGFDISDAQFPPEHPSNVSFRVHDAKRSFDQELHGKFDLVHVRALVAAMNATDWEIVVSNLFALLKPGGALQWTEADLSRLRCLRGQESITPFNAIPRLLKMFHEVSFNQLEYAINELSTLFERAGLQGVQTDIISSDRVPNTRSTLSAVYLAAIIGWAQASKTLVGEDLEVMRLQVQQEIEAGAYVRGDAFTITAFK